MQQTIREIKKKFRLAMNGDVSTSMRRVGMDYKLNFGVSVPTIRKIAAGYYPNKYLAEYLINEEVRESKIMATLLWKVEDFTPEKAAEWVEKTNKLEIAEQAAMNLYSKLPYAKELALKWTVSANPVERMNGHLTLVRLIIQGTELSVADLEQPVKSLMSDLTEQGTTLFSLSLNALKRIGKLGPEVRSFVLEQFSSEDNSNWNEIKCELETEYSYYD